MRFALTLVMFLTLALLAACSDLGSDSCPDGTEFCGVDGSIGGADGARFADPAPKTKTITLGCTNSVAADVFIMSWDLTVDPGPIVGGEAFGALFHGLVVLDDDLLDLAQTSLSGYKRSNLLELQATVLVRAGVTSETREVVLRPEPIQRTCTYDDSGSNGPEAGPFSTCSAANDNPDGSNENCTGLGGMPDPANLCGEFTTLTTSNDCDPGGTCDDLRKAGPMSQCAQNGFCVTGPLEIVLEGEVEGFQAEGAGSVLFGWDDENTGAVIDESGGANDGAYILPDAELEASLGPNAFRSLIARVGPIAFECTMAVGPSARLTPTPDADLISFEIQTR